jgi:hypothetical protein
MDFTLPWLTEQHPNKRQGSGLKNCVAGDKRRVTLLLFSCSLGAGANMAHAMGQKSDAEQHNRGGSLESHLEINYTVHRPQASGYSPLLSVYLPNSWVISDWSQCISGTHRILT